MVLPSPYRWMPLVCAALLGAAACASPAPPPAERAQGGIRVVGQQQSRIALNGPGLQRGARVESPSSDFLKASPPPGAIQLEELLAPGDRPLAGDGLCPSDMASIEDRYCIDRYEGSLLEVLPNGDERSFDRNSMVEGHTFRAVNGAGLIPQGSISANQAEGACRRSGKRLCSPGEWRRACRGPEKTQYGYGNTNEAGRCNDHGKSPMRVRFGLGGSPSQAHEWTIQKMNDPSLNQTEGTLAPSGTHSGCTNGFGVYDMVGNLHEWTNDPEGTFLGGYYLDIHQNGDGCDYRTGAHAVWYHDYSTGFRCCADVAQ